MQRKGKIITEQDSNEFYDPDFFLCSSEGDKNFSIWRYRDHLQRHFMMQNVHDEFWEDKILLNLSVQDNWNRNWNGQGGKQSSQVVNWVQLKVSKIDVPTMKMLNLKQ